MRFVCWSLKSHQGGFPKRSSPRSHERLTAGLKGSRARPRRPGGPADSPVGWCGEQAAGFGEDSDKFVFKASAGRKDFLLTFLYVCSFIIPILSAWWMWMVIRKKLAMGFCFTSDYNANPENTALAQGLREPRRAGRAQFAVPDTDFCPDTPGSPICRRGKVRVWGTQMWMYHGSYLVEGNKQVGGRDMFVNNYKLRQNTNIK